MRLARIVDGKVVEIAIVADMVVDFFGEEPRNSIVTDFFPESLGFEEVDEEVDVNWTLDGEEFSEPGDPEDVIISPRTKFSFLDFIELFEESEQMAITGSEITQIKLFLLKAAGAEYIDLEDPRTIGGLNALVSLELLTEARRDAVLAGEAP